ncbi:enoyl-CoA hydratase [Pseudonocardia humida]|uniref:Enoyl-CoA hydratase n=1 Tax=Pseudonocardia humida TaxID=2800819 RepID=A0ABT0ZSC9_9PSEU|nr:enoyl-CoA hydratase [Pseudonocardia humida]MCO1653623.1 enoyl-CoA hydratase [Pseudonocardia humida]
MSERVLLVADVGAVRVLTLNRPGARNALSGELISALYAALLAADDAPDVRAVVLTGTDPAFCAGVDLKQAAAEGAAYFARYRREDCIGQVGRMRKPVVGAINGAAFTGGLEVALGCDFLVASERAVFADTHARVGVLPGGGMTARLPALVGQGWARRMSMTGDPVPAELAARIGLVTEVVAHEEVRARAVALAAAAAEVPGEVMAPIKRMYVEGGGVGAALEVERGIAGAHTTDVAGLEARRLAVLARNRSRIAEGTQ